VRHDDDDENDEKAGGGRGRGGRDDDAADGGVFPRRSTSARAGTAGQASVRGTPSFQYNSWMGRQRRDETPQQQQRSGARPDAADDQRFERAFYEHEDGTQGDDFDPFAALSGPSGASSAADSKPKPKKRSQVQLDNDK
jgi:hypothetical protein